VTAEFVVVDDAMGSELARLDKVLDGAPLHFRERARWQALRNAHLDTAAFLEAYALGKADVRDTYASGTIFRILTGWNLQKTRCYGDAIAKLESQHADSPPVNLEPPE